VGKTDKRAGELAWGILSGSVGPRVRLLRNELHGRSIVASAPYRLPTGSLTVLALIAANPGSSQTALARRAGLNNSALVGIVDQLEQRTLVKRGRAANDRRRYQLSVTPQGRRMMETLFSVVTKEEGPIRDALGAYDMAALLGLLDRVIVALEGGQSGAEAPG
jgi:DNA-binding MarR family transcriptional regulator